MQFASTINYKYQHTCSLCHYLLFRWIIHYRSSTCKIKTYIRFYYNLCTSHVTFKHIVLFLASFLRQSLQLIQFPPCTINHFSCLSLWVHFCCNGSCSSCITKIETIYHAAIAFTLLWFIIINKWSSFSCCNTYQVLKQCPTSFHEIPMLWSHLDAQCLSWEIQ